MDAPLELRAERDGERTLLRSPEVGYLTCARAQGALLGPGEEVGVLLQLGRARRLVLPAGVHGRVVSERPERVHAPVEYGAVLYELEPLGDATLAQVAQAAPQDDALGLVLRATQAGRFYASPSPEEPPFVSAGTVVEEGKPVGLVEVMKTFAHVPYRATGGLPARARVVRVLVADGAELKEGDALIEVEPC